MLYSIIVLLIVSIFIIDWIPQLNTWQSRIHIGRFKSNKEWHSKVFNCSKKWLLKTPTIKLTDNNRLIIIDILKGNYKRSAIQSWQEAALVLGLSAQYKKKKDEDIKKLIEKYILTKIDDSGNWKQKINESDGVILGYALIQLHWIDQQKYKPAYDALWKLLLELKGEHETVSYKKFNTNYRYVDTIGFICPFLVEYGKQFQVPEAIDLAVKQIEEFNQFALYKDTFIPCHTYTLDTKMPVGLFGWGRGLGWYAIGLIDAWKALPSESTYKKQLESYVLKFANMAIQHQSDNGAWHWIITAKESRFDSSTTATLAWFLKQASQIMEIQKETSLASEKALAYLQQMTRRNGAVDFSQGDTKAIGVHSQEFDILPFTQGFVLRTLNI